MEIEMRCSHRTADCPKCKKDTYIGEMEAHFCVVECPWCKTKFKGGKIVKKDEK